MLVYWKHVFRNEWKRVGEGRRGKTDFRGGGGDDSDGSVLSIRSLHMFLTRLAAITSIIGTYIDMYNSTIQISAHVTCCIPNNDLINRIHRQGALPRWLVICIRPAPLVTSTFRTATLVTSDSFELGEFSRVKSSIRIRSARPTTIARDCRTTTTSICGIGGINRKESCWFGSGSGIGGFGLFKRSDSICHAAYMFSIDRHKHRREGREEEARNGESLGEIAYKFWFESNMSCTHKTLSYSYGLEKKRTVSHFECFN